MMKRLYSQIAVLGLLLLQICQHCHTLSSWLDNANVMAWQLNPQLYLLGAAPKCTVSKAQLSPLQNAMCTAGGYMDHMSSVNVGLLIALNECRYQLKSRKWNCSDVEVESMLEGLSNIEASREDAFVHAVSAAGVAHAIARACRNGLISKCSCSDMARPDSLHNDWVWGGCGDNVNYGYEFASVFIDLRERESNYPKGSQQLAVMLMNKHNNEAGRTIVEKGDTIACKCHGVSGSCVIRTCWQELSPFRKIGDRLKDNYETAMQVEFNKAGTSLKNTMPTRRSKRKASKEELVYLQPMEDICNSPSEDSNSTIITTAGRKCDPFSTGEDNCKSLCCDRGFEKVTLNVKEKCNCQFNWCCFVQCEECSKVIETHVCR